MANKIMLEAIDELKNAEVVLTMTAQKCSNARKLLEKAAGLSPAPEKGSNKASEAIVVHITTRRRKNLLKKGIK